MKYNKMNVKEFDQRAEKIEKWIEENGELYEWAKDPNAYEMTDVFLIAGEYISEGKNANLNVLKSIWELRKGDFERCGIEENQFVYQICKQTYDATISGRALVNDEGSHNALSKMAGVGLYIMQQRREEDIDYNNIGELVNLIEDTRKLKQRHPQLHDNLKFANNINVLYRLQKLHLDEKNAVKLDEVYNNYERTQTETNRDFDDEREM